MSVRAQVKQAATRSIRYLALEFSIRNRKLKARRIGDYLSAHECRTVAFVGVLGPGDHEYRSNAVFERAVTQLADVRVALDVVERQTEWPFVVGDGRALPWRTDAVDTVISNAVIEHVGDEADQLRFVAEHARVGRTWVITTPNRWFPVESHTFAVFKHWSPGWRAARSDFTRLLSLGEFRRLLPEGTTVHGHWWSPTFMAVAAPWEGPADHATPPVRGVG